MEAGNVTSPIVEEEDVAHVVVEGEDTTALPMSMMMHHKIEVTVMTLLLMNTVVATMLLLLNTAYMYDRGGFDAPTQGRGRGREGRRGRGGHGGGFNNRSDGPPIQLAA